MRRAAVLAVVALLGAADLPPSARAQRCDPSYPTVCIPPAPPDLDCDEIDECMFEVRGTDPHRFDHDHDGLGCETCD